MTIQDVDSEFQKRVLKDMRLMEIRSWIRHGTATFADTAEYNDRASTILGDVLSGQMPSTPDGERAKLCKYMLRHLYDDTNEMCTAVQQTLDKAQGLHLAPQKAPFPTERVQAIAGSLEDKTVPMETTQRRARSSATVGRSFHDDRMKAEADFRSRAGLKCYIVRNGGAKCCEWCAAMVGRYAYGDEPGDVYRRHDNCSCTVIYENGRQRQDVWSKRSWEAPAEGAGADALTIFMDETRPEGAAEAVRLTAEEAAQKERENALRYLTGITEYDTIKTEGAPEDLFDRKASISSYQDDLKAVNPNFDVDEGYRINCPKCVATYALRRKGFNVEALPTRNGDPIDELIAKASSSLWKIGGLPVTVKRPIKSKYFGKPEIIEAMRDLPDGAMFVVRCEWETGKAHVFIAEKIKGRTCFIDPQTGDDDVSSYFSKMKKNRTAFWRIDNARLNEDLIEYCCISKGASRDDTS